MTVFGIFPESDACAQEAILHYSRGVTEAHITLISVLRRCHHGHANLAPAWS